MLFGDSFKVESLKNKDYKILDQVCLYHGVWALQFDSQGVCTRLACGSLFYTRLLINLGGLFFCSSRMFRKIKNFTNSRQLIITADFHTRFLRSLNSLYIFSCRFYLSSWRIQGGNKICVRLISLLKMHNLEVILARSPYTCENRNMVWRNKYTWRTLNGCSSC